MQCQQPTGGYRRCIAQILDCRAHESHVVGDGTCLRAQPPDLFPLAQLRQSNLVS